MQSQTAPGGAATVIRTPDQRLRVFVSSTLAELAPERAAVQQAVESLRLTPVMFELGARPHPPRDLYRAYLAQSHIFIGLYWQRYGWVAPEMDISGLEDEYRLAGDMPRLIYIKAPAPEREPRLDALIDSIREGGVSYRRFSTPGELRELVENDLALLLTERFEEALRREGSSAAPGFAPGDAPALPQPPTPLVGREREVAAVSDLVLRGDVRLTTLTGPGGVGKTRVALAVAHHLRGDFPGGAYWVPLSAVREPGLVLSAVAAALDVRERAPEPLLDSVKNYLRDRRLLIVLDNFEQVLPAADLLADLLTAAPGLDLIATSRAALDIRGEHEYEVPPLDVPSDHLRAAESDGVRLFVERARAASAGFALTAENTPAVAEIVRRLDGLPLAIELAAARVRLLPPDRLLERLDSRLDLLTGGSRDLPARQRTMRATLDWSYSLLDADHQRLLAQLGVFAGSFDLAAAEAVCEPYSGIALLDALQTLLVHSLLHGEIGPDGEARFHILNVIREYAVERLAALGEDSAARERHARYYAQLLTDGIQIFSGASAEWLKRLQANYDDIRAALDWFERDTALHEIGWTALVALSWLWYRSGDLTEGRRRYARAVEAARKLGDDSLHGTVLSQAGLIAMWQSDLPAAVRLMDQGLAVLRAAGGGSFELLTALFARGVLAVNMGDQVTAEAVLGEALPALRDAGQKSFLAMTLLHLGNAALERGDVPRAREYMDETFALGRQEGDGWILASAINNFGELARFEGDYDTAGKLYAESRALFEANHSAPDLARADHSLGFVALAAGDVEAARELFDRSQSQHRKLGVPRGVAEAAAGLAAVAAARGDYQRAVQLVSAARARFEALSAGVWPADRQEADRVLAQSRRALGEEAFGAAWQVGEAASLDDLLGST